MRNWMRRRSQVFVCLRSNESNQVLFATGMATMAMCLALCVPCNFSAVQFHRKHVDSSNEK